MKVLDLQCQQGHRFEGWFADELAFRKQQSSGLLECPVCGDVIVQKLLSAPRLNLAACSPSSSRDEQSAAGRNEGLARGAPSDDAGHLLTQARAWVASAENVGERFVEEVRAMHGGEVPERAIRGVATAEQAQELHAEGIGVLAVPKFLCEPHH